MSIDQYIDDIVDEIFRIEGAHSDNENDLGGATMYGITEAVARKHGWRGRMQDIPKPLARSWYIADYIVEPEFDRIIQHSEKIAREIIDSGVNMGPATASIFLQRWLNAFNNMGEYWPDLRIDGRVGDKTIAALRRFLAMRGDEGERVMVAAMNCTQGTAYLTMTEHREKHETFTYGWLLNRVTNQWPHL